MAAFTSAAAFRRISTLVEHFRRRSGALGPHLAGAIPLAQGPFADADQSRRFGRENVCIGNARMRASGVRCKCGPAAMEKREPSRRTPAGNRLEG